MKGGLIEAAFSGRSSLIIDFFPPFMKGGLIEATPEPADAQWPAAFPPFMKGGLIEAWPSRIHLQVEDRDLGSLLLVAGQFGETVGESVGDAEVHLIRKIGRGETLPLHSLTCRPVLGPVLSR